MGGTEVWLPLARQILDRPDQPRTLAALSATLQSVTHGLQSRLTDMLGETAVSELFRQTIQRAAAQCSILQGVAAFDQGVEATIALRRKTDQDYDAVHEAFLVLLATFLADLANMIGSRLVRVLVQNAAL
jgi:hypothetical protein